MPIRPQDLPLFRARLNTASMLYRAICPDPREPARDTRSAGLLPEGHLFLMTTAADGRDEVYRPSTFERTALIDELARRREREMEKAGLIAPGKALLLAGGKILEYRLDQSDHDGLARYHSRGLFDEFDIPGHDSWLMLVRSEFGDVLLAWIPREFIEDAEAGMWACPSKCLRWVEGV